MSELRSILHPNVNTKTNLDYGGTVAPRHRRTFPPGAETRGRMFLLRVGSEPNPRLSSTRLILSISTGSTRIGEKE